MSNVYILSDLGFSSASVCDRRALIRIGLVGMFGYGERRKPGEAKS